MNIKRTIILVIIAASIFSLCTACKPSDDIPAIPKKSLLPPKTFSENEFSITLTEDFKEREDEGSYIAFESNYVLVFVYRDLEMYYDSPEQCIEYFASFYDLAAGDGVQKENGLTFIEYKARGYFTRCYIVEKGDTYYLIELIAYDYLAVSPHYESWINSIEIDLDKVSSEARSFTSKEMTITLTENFEDISAGGYFSSYMSCDTAIYVWRMRNGGYTSVDEYLKERIDESYLPGGIIKENGLIYYEYTEEWGKQTIHHVVFTVESPHSYYTVQFTSKEGSEDLAAYSECVRSIKIGDTPVDFEPVTFTTNDFTITLTEDFAQEPEEEGAYFFTNADISIMVYKNPIMAESSLSLAEYAEAMISEYGLDASVKAVETDGHIRFEWISEDEVPYRFIDCVYKEGDTFYLVEFAVPDKLNADYAEDFAAWARSFKPQFNAVIS